MFGFGASGNTENARLITANSSSATLANNETFTGVYTSTLWFPSLSVAVLTDKSGTLYVDYSADGVTAQSTLSYTVTANTNEVHRITNTRAYFRCRFLNDSGDTQTSFSLQATLGMFVALNQSINSVLQQDADSTSTRPTDYHYEVALNRRAGNTTWNKFGFNGDIDTGTETIWSAGGVFTRMTAPDTLNITSTNINDTSAGTGARSIIIYGINQNYEAITEVVIMNGTNNVVTTNQYLGVNRMAIYLAGTSGQNAGIITAKVTTGGTNTQAHMPIGAGTTQQCFFFSQVNHTLLLDWLYITLVKNAGGAQPKVTILGWVTSLVSGAKYEVFRDYLNGTVENHTELNPSQPFVVGEKSLIEFQATTDVDNTEVSLRFSLIEVKDF